MVKIQQLSFCRPLLLWGMGIAIAIPLAVAQTGILTEPWFNPGGLPLLWRFLQASWQPDLSPAILRLTVQSTWITLAYAVCGTVLSLVLGLVGGLLASEVWWLTLFPHRQGISAAWLGVRAVLAVPRAIHELIWGLFLINILGLDPLVGILAIALPFGAITAKVFSEILDETPRQPLLALVHTGVPPLSAILYGLLPQAFLNLLSYSFYRFECSIRSATVLGVIGAGGLGYQIFLSLQSLRYPQLWTFFLALFILNGSVDLTSAWMRRRLGCASRLDLNLRCWRPQRPSYRRDPWLLGIGVGVGILIPLCFGFVGADYARLRDPQTLVRLGDILQQSWPPELGISWLELGELAGQTLAMSILAIAMATLGGILLSFPAALNLWVPGGLLNPHRNHNGFWAWAWLLATRLLLLISRAIPAPIWALVFLFILFPGILPGAIALGLHNLGILGRLMAEVVENLRPAPLEALKAQGSSNSAIFLYGILPASLPQFLAYSLYRWEVCMRETVIVGLVGAGGLGRLIAEQLSSFDYPGLMVSLGCLVLLTWGVDGISGMVRRSLRAA